MEREILFRGKLSHSGVWVEGNLIKDRNGNKYIIPFNVFEPDGHHLIIDSDEAWRVDSETVGQFTGATDRNGKKVFDGDIIGPTDFGYDGVVYFDELIYVQCECTISDDIEIVGNVYDNPELL